MRRKSIRIRGLWLHGARLAIRITWHSTQIRSSCSGAVDWVPRAHGRSIPHYLRPRFGVCCVVRVTSLHLWILPISGIKILGLANCVCLVRRSASSSVVHCHPSRRRPSTPWAIWQATGNGLAVCHRKRGNSGSIACHLINSIFLYVLSVQIWLRSAPQRLLAEITYLLCIRANHWSRPLCGRNGSSR